MQEMWTEYYELLAGTSFVLFLAYFSLLLSWPFFLVLEKITPVNRQTPRSNFFFNWKIEFICWGSISERAKNPANENTQNKQFSDEVTPFV